MHRFKPHALVICAAVAAGCSHKMVSPPVTTGATAPDLVCTEQLTTNVQLSGRDFAPAIEKALTTPELVLPKVTLTRSKDLTGAPAAGTFQIPDDPSQAASSRLHWSSKQSLTFQVFPDLRLATGLYDVTVTNPDGKHSATSTGALAAVPRPTVNAITPDLLCCSEMDQTVVLTGSDFVSVANTLPVVKVGSQSFTATKLDGCTPVPGMHSEGDVEDCKSATFVIPKGSFDPGAYSVTVTNPAPAGCVSSDQITLTIVPPPSVSTVVPDLACDAEGDQTVTVNGTGFLQTGATLPTVKVGDQLFTPTGDSGCSPVAGTFREGAVQECTALTVKIPQGTFMPGAYPVVVQNPAPADCVSTEMVSLTIVPPPSASSVVADLVCDAQGDQSMTLNGANLLTLGSTLPTVTIGTVTVTASTASGCTPVAGTFAEGAAAECTSLSFTLPQGALMAGDYPVTVTNPTPAGCVSMTPVNLHVAPPPSLASAQPLAVCDAQNTQAIALNGTGFLEVGSMLPIVTIGGMSMTVTGASGCTQITGEFAEGTVQECTGLTVTLPQGALGPGSYPVVLTNPLPADCMTTESVMLGVDAPPVVSDVVPHTVCQGGGSLQINGQGFQPTATVSLQGQGLPTISSARSTVNQSGTQIDSLVGGGASPGDVYNVVVDNGDGCSDPSPHQQVTVIAGPVAFFADPNVVYNGINTRVTVYATTLEQPLPANAVQIVPSGQTSPATQLTWNAVPGHPNRVQVVVPEGQAAGTYDLMMNDASGCQTVLAKALTVTSSLTVSVKDVVPPFGYTGSDTAVTIFRDTSAAAPANAPFVQTPRVFLNPSNPGPSDIAIQPASVSFMNPDTLTAVVPANEPAHSYDLVIVNPDGTVGVLSNAFTVQSVPPPTIATVTPSSIVQATGQTVTIAGEQFTNSTVSLSCEDAAGAAETAPSVVSGTVSCSGGSSCRQQATINASAISAGSVCVLRLTNSDGSYFDYSAIGVTNSSLNLSSPQAGTTMNVGRRALVGASGDATAAARFVYAIGGDGGAAMANAPFSSVEFAPVDLYGHMGAWQIARNSLGTARSFAAGVSMGRYLYVLGGSDGTMALSSAERAEILDPSEVPHLDVEDIVPAATGLDPGDWIYRVSATFAASDPDNPGGESLPSDEIIVRVPQVAGKKIQLVLHWQSPVDTLGTPLPNVSGYRIYRTPVSNGASGSEVLIATVGASTLDFTDDGTATPETATPLPLGSTGSWTQLPAMASTRKGLAAAAAFDPADPTTFYVYALLGQDSSGTALTSYEYLPVAIQPNGHQTVGAWKKGLLPSSTGRWALNAWVADDTVSSTVPAGSTFVYLGGGLLANGSLTGKVEAGLVAAGGDLGILSDTPKDFSSAVAGYGVCAANDQLFALGGGTPGAPTNKVISATLTSPPPSLANNSWNAGAQLMEARFMPGNTVQSAFIFLIGGETGTSAADRSTETVIW